MMHKLFLLLCCVMLLTGCGKDAPPSPAAATCNCGSLKQGIMTQNFNQVKTEIDQLCSDLLPSVTATDAFGQEPNLYVLAQRIGQCGIQAEVISYAGVMTYPPQSEIKVSLNENVLVYTTILDICTDQQNMMYLIHMHE